MFIINVLFKEMIIYFFKDNWMIIVELILFYQLYIILLQSKNKIVSY
ncbi:hypothetical protein EDB96_1341 [Flavobacterium sp. S87F.05.LMB.W.Kidney.N]|nr:hypothetical protein EDB96_1341 [Flavobacterium sp. S87F.05.LMB.W.Kidney.N]